MFLTHDDLIELTGSPWRRRQIEWLRARGWHFEVSYKGYPVVARAEVEARMVGNRQQPQDGQSAIRWDKVA